MCVGTALTAGCRNLPWGPPLLVVAAAKFTFLRHEHKNKWKMTTENAWEPKSSFVKSSTQITESSFSTCYRVLVCVCEGSVLNERELNSKLLLVRGHRLSLSPRSVSGCLLHLVRYQTCVLKSLLTHEGPLLCFSFSVVHYAPWKAWSLLTIDRHK